MENEPNKEKDDLRTLYLVLKEVEDMWIDIKRTVQDYHKTSDNLMKDISMIKNISAAIVFLTILNIVIFLATLIILFLKK
ncbi:MAG: hypothetical protein RMJ38_00630 [candidate division WOR-3 bacterium]|nr:hypothetical protein [candidate division WOR-3 bacterium]MDW8149939.1 hypothetical protein [candidate division WOR-3 bacterium]